MLVIIRPPITCSLQKNLKIILVFAADSIARPKDCKILVLASLVSFSFFAVGGMEGRKGQYR